MSRDEIRMAELLSALSVATDLAMALAPEQCVRTCLVATGLARQLALPESEVSDVYYTTLVRHLGCTATTHEEAYLFGPDERALRPLAERTDDGNRREVLRLLLQAGKGTGVHRIRYLARTVRAGAETGATLLRAVCEVGSMLAERLGLGAGVTRSVHQLLERWDGTGVPQRLAGEQIALPARLTMVATQAVIFDRLGGRTPLSRPSTAVPAAGSTPRRSRCSTPSARSCSGRSTPSTCGTRYSTRNPGPTGASRPATSTRWPSPSPTSPT